MKQIPCGLFVAVFLPMAAMSQDKNDEQAKAMFKEGSQRFKAEAYGDAAKMFRGAYELKPSYKILYNLAQSEAAAKRYGVALETFEKYLADGGDEIELSRQDEVQTEIARLRVMTGIVQVDAEEGMVIVVDGTRRGTFPTTQRVPVAATVVHEVVAVTADGNEIRKEIRVSGGDSISVSLTPDDESVAAVEPVDDATTAVSPPVPTDTSDASAKKTRLFVGGLAVAGTGVALVVAGSVCGALVLKKENTLSSRCTGGVCSADEQRIIDSRDRLLTASTVLWVVGGTLAAAGGALILVSKLKKEKKTVSFYPTLGGFAVEGRF